jgi:hypothetical protein
MSSPEALGAKPTTVGWAIQISGFPIGFEGGASFGMPGRARRRCTPEIGFRSVLFRNAASIC